MARIRKIPKISVLNWMGTLLLCSIPGVNLIALICFMIFAKSPSKKTFAIAVLLWSVLAVIAVIVLLLVFPTQVGDVADRMREIAATVPSPAPVN